MILNATEEMVSAGAELGRIAVGCKQYGLVCTPIDEFNKFTFAIAIVGMIIGAICILMYQYTRRKGKERIAAQEAAGKREEAEGNK